MRITLVLLFIILSNNLFSQISVSRDTLSNDQGDLSITYIITGQFPNISELSVQQFTVDGLDTTSVFYGVYNADEDDPSSFRTLTSDETAGQYELGIGSFTPTQFYSKVIITKLTGLPEEFIFN